MEQARKPPFHPEALATFNNARHAFECIRDRLQTRQKLLRVVDYGSGVFGCGRALLGSILKPTNAEVFLYDPHVEIEKPFTPLARIIDDKQLNTLESVDWINLSYVMSHVETETEMRSMLEKLRSKFPEATITIIDYALRNHSKIDALNILARSDAEEKERIAMGNDARFLDLHTRMDATDLHRLAKDAGITAAHGMPIAEDGSHYLIEAEPNTPRYSWFSFGNA